MAIGDPVVTILKTMPTSVPPALKTMTGASSPPEAIPFWEFSDTQAGSVDYLCVLKGYAGSGLSFRLGWASTVNFANNCVWQAAIRRIPDDSEDLNTTAFTYDFNTVTANPASTVGEVVYDLVNFVDGADMDSLADGELFILRILRNPADASDNLGGAAQLMSVDGYEALVTAIDNCTEPTCTDVSPGTDLTALINAGTTNHTFWLAPGTHRFTAPLKAGQTLRGDPGAILNGSVLVTAWTHTGSVWTANVTSSTETGGGECTDGTNLCTFPEDLFRNSARVTRVVSAAAVVAATFHYQKSTGVLTYGSDPTGATMELSVLPYAVLSSADNVTIKDIIVEKFAVRAQRGAICLSGAGCLVSNVEVRYCHGIGVQLLGSGNSMVGGSTHDNMQMGASATGVGHTYNGVHIYNNNKSTNPYKPGWEAGGTKFTNTTGLLVQNCEVDNNGGPGLWTDIDNVNTTYDSNNSHDNDRAGIFVEISYDTIISNNTVTNNGNTFPIQWIGNPGILIAESKNVQVYNNTLSGNQAGIMAMEQVRNPGPLGTHVVQNLNVHDNTITQAGNFAAGLVCDTGETIFWPHPPSSGQNIQWVHNTYHTSAGAQWAWDNGGRSFAYWQGTGGQDTTGSGP